MIFHKKALPKKKKKNYLLHLYELKSQHSFMNVNWYFTKNGYNGCVCGSGMGCSTGNLWETKQSSQVETGGQNGDSRLCLGTKRRAALCTRRAELLS